MKALEQELRIIKTVYIKSSLKLVSKYSPIDNDIVSQKRSKILEQTKLSTAVLNGHLKNLRHAHTTLDIIAAV